MLKRLRVLLRSLAQNPFRTIALVFRRLAPILLGIFLFVRPSIVRKTLRPQDVRLVSPLPTFFRSGQAVSLVDFLGFEVRRIRRGEARKLSDGVVPLNPRSRRARARMQKRRAWRGGMGNDEWEYGAGAQVLSVRRQVLESETVERLAVGAENGVRWLFCEVPGVGQEVLAELGGGQRLAELSIRDRERWLGEKDVLRWVAVAHPWVRAVNFWLRGVRESELDSEEYRRFMGIVRGRNLTENEREVDKISLSLYFMFLGRQNRDDLDASVKPIVDLCGWSDVSYNFVARWESMEEDLNAVGNKLGKSFLLSIQKAKEEHESWTRLQQYIPQSRTKKSIARAVKLYRDDMNTFKYSFEGILA